MAASDQEQAAKNWQVSAVEGRVVALEKLTERVDEKLDTIVQGMVTSQQYEARLNLMEKTFNERLLSAIREVNLEYRPMAKNLTWLTRAVIMGVMGIVAQIIVFFITIRSS